MSRIDDQSCATRTQCSRRPRGRRLVVNQAPAQDAHRSGAFCFRRTPHRDVLDCLSHPHPRSRSRSVFSNTMSSESPAEACISLRGDTYSLRVGSAFITTLVLTVERAERTGDIMLVCHLSVPFLSLLCIVTDLPLPSLLFLCLTHAPKSPYGSARGGFMRYTVHGWPASTFPPHNTSF